MDKFLEKYSLLKPMRGEINLNSLMSIKEITLSKGPQMVSLVNSIKYLRNK